jgi:hypothetical protein
MRYYQLKELFDKRAEYEITENNHSEFSAEFYSNGLKILWIATLEDVYDDDFNSLGYQWDVAFSQIDSKGYCQFEITNNGNEFEVMSTVKAIMQDFIRLRKPDVFKFSAVSEEQSRVTLYTKMAMKFIPKEYSMEIKTIHSNEIFVFTKGKK